MYYLFNIPDFDSIIFTWTNKLISFFRRKAHTTDVHGVSLENRYALYLIENSVFRIIFPKSNLIIFGTCKYKIFEYIYWYDNISVTSNDFGVSIFQIN